MTTQKSGGNPQALENSATVASMPRSVAFALPIEGTRKTQTFKANSQNELMAQIPQEFGVTMQNASGASVKQKIQITKMQHLDLKHHTSNNTVLREQKMQKKFLQAFLTEWQNNPSFRAQMESILADKTRKAQLVKVLRGMSGDVRKKVSPLQRFLQAVRTDANSMN